MFVSVTATFRLTISFRQCNFSLSKSNWGRNEMRDIAKNASGDLFEIWRRDDVWYAEQITGCQKNWLGLAALLHATSRFALLRDLRAHWSNE